MSLTPSFLVVTQNVDNIHQGRAFVDVNATGCIASGIKLRTLDDYWTQVLDKAHVFLMKMDIQGFEGFAILGAHTMLKTKPPAFFFIEFSASQYVKLGLDPHKYF